MKPCACGSTEVGKVIGVQYDMDDRVAGIVHNCRCRTTRILRWEEADERTRRAAVVAETERMAKEGAV